MPDRSRIKTTHVMWIERYFTTEESVWKNTFDNFLTPFGNDLLFRCKYDLEFLKESLATYYYHMLRPWKEYRERMCGHIVLTKLRQILWSNTLIRMNNSPVFYKKVASLGCFFVADLHHKGVLKTFDYCVKKEAFSVL